MTLQNLRLTAGTKSEIERISKEFAKGMGIELSGSGWLIVEPLSSFLSGCGYKNNTYCAPESDKHPLVLMMQFEGTQDVLIPAGEDLKPINNKAKNWMWI